MKIEEWVKAAPGRSWDHATSSYSYASQRPQQEFKVKLFENKKTVSVGSGPTLTFAKEDAMRCLPKSRR